MKSPLEMVVSAVRALDGEATDSFTLAQKVADMGEPLYGKRARPVSDTGRAWLSTANVMARIELRQLPWRPGRLPGVKVDQLRDSSGKDAAAIARESAGPRALRRRRWRRSRRGCKANSRRPR